MDRLSSNAPGQRDIAHTFRSPPSQAQSPWGSPDSGNWEGRFTLRPSPKGAKLGQGPELSEPSGWGKVPLESLRKLPFWWVLLWLNDGKVWGNGRRLLITGIELGAQEMTPHGTSSTFLK